ncbi:MAG: carboxypeptidase regulatory-like domain-containing protein [Candidatus Sulfotelmatobacter sp.]
MVRFYIHTVRILALAAAFAPVLGQSTQAQTPEAPERTATATLQGVVRDSAGHPVAGATVCLRVKDAQIHTAHTDSAGKYLFSALRQGSYVLQAEMPGYERATSTSIVLAPNEAKSIDLTLNFSGPAAAKKSSQPQPEFFDEPHFTVAGVTDTTSLGGHGSDTIVRNREALAVETASLGKQPAASSARNSSNPETEKSLREAAARQPQDFDATYHLGKFLVEDAKAHEALPYLELASRLNPRSFDNAYELALAYDQSADYVHARSDAQALLADQSRSPQEKAQLHHLLGDLDERLGNALEAVREYQTAAELDPSETNLFDWGAELLTHRAAEPAIEVFTKGNRLFPRSARMLSGLGAAWYSLGSFDHAGQRFCEASDLNPDDPNPYLLMGKMQAAETVDSPAILERLARFARLEPQNALANYYYAVSLWKRRNSPAADDLDQIQSLLERAVHLDPNLGLGYLELGIVYSEQKDIPKAVSALQQALGATPRLEEAHYRLAQIYRQMGDPSKAHAELQLYEQMSAEKTQEVARQRHEVQQFVYQLRDKPLDSQTQ